MFLRGLLFFRFLLMNYPTICLSHFMSIMHAKANKSYAIAIMIMYVL